MKLGSFEPKRNDRFINDNSTKSLSKSNLIGLFMKYDSLIIFIGITFFMITFVTFYLKFCVSFYYIPFK